MTSPESDNNIWFLGTLARIKASGKTTGGAMSVIEFTHPPGFATPKHVHSREDEAFYILEGAMQAQCGEKSFRATPGSLVWMPKGVPHSYAVEGDEPLRSLAITMPAGFEEFVAEVGEPALTDELPQPAEPDIPLLVAAAERHGQQILGPPGS